MNPIKNLDTTSLHFDKRSWLFEPFVRAAFKTVILTTPIIVSFRYLRHICNCIVLFLTFMVLAPGNLSAQGGLQAIIDDSDGYTNIRATGTKDSKVIGRVVEGERFTVYPNDSSWWAISTTYGVNGFIHRSCVRLLDETKEVVKNPANSITRDEKTLAAWNHYVSIQERGRKHSREGGDGYTGQWLLTQIADLDLAGVNPAIVSFIQDIIKQAKWEEAVFRQVMSAVREVEPAIALQNTLRPLAGALGARLIPENPELGSVLGEILVLYVFADRTVAKDLPADDTKFKLLKMHDRMLVGEALINTALGLEQPEGLKILLGYVRDRAFSARFQVGRWIFTDVDGGRGDLEFRQNPKSAYHAGGWVTLKWRNRRIEDKFFQYEFYDDHTLHLKDTSMIGVLAGSFAFEKTFKVKFIKPTILKLTEVNGDPRGAWEQISPDKINRDR